jgi:cation diffusion facilitator family transporter
VPGRAAGRAARRTLFIMSAHLRRRLPEDAGDRITVVGIFVNILLLAVKLAVGAITGSAGLVADGIHSGSDMATDLAVLGGMHVARRKPDSEHPYGHGRFETMAGGVVAGALILVGLYIAWDGMIALYRGIHSFPGPWIIGVAGLSILLKEWLYRRTVSVARAVGSSALHANAWHHRSDALSSIAVMAGGIGALAGWGHADEVAAVIVGLMVVTAGGKTMMRVFHEISEGGLSSAELATIEDAIRSVPGVKEWHQLRGRMVGREMFIDVHVLVDPTLVVVESHRISMDVEEAIHQANTRPINVIVHIEPDSEELRGHHE